MSDEARDAAMLELRLAADPKVTARREAFWASVKAFREKSADKTKAEMIAELKAHNPGYILDLLNAEPEDSVRGRYVMTFHSEGSK